MADTKAEKKVLRRVDLMVPLKVGKKADYWDAAAAGWMAYSMDSPLVGMMAVCSVAMMAG